MGQDMGMGEEEDDENLIHELQEVVQEQSELISELKKIIRANDEHS